MCETATKAALIIHLLQTSRAGRMSVRSIQESTGLSRESVYRYVRAIARVLPVVTQNGMIVIDRRQGMSQGVPVIP